MLHTLSSLDMNVFIHKSIRMQLEAQCVQPVIYFNLFVSVYSRQPYPK